MVKEGNMTARQRALLAKVQSTPEWRSASPRERKALIEAGIVESNLRNLNYGDRDSKGFLQQRPSQGWKNPTHVETATKSFLDRARAANNQGGSAGQLAQRVQRSAFPARYDQKAGQADAILGSTSSRTSSPASSGRQAGVSDGDARQQAVLAYLQSNSKDPLDLALSYRQIRDSQPATPEKTSSAYRAPSSSSKGGVAEFDGKPVAAWIKPVLDYARAKGWKGTVTSGYRSDAEQTRIYRSGVRPAAVPKSLGGDGSKHSETNFLGGAVDVSDAATLNRILRAKHSRLKYAGAKDPVHFSVPNPDGSY